MIEILDEIKDKIVGDEESSEETNETPETESSDDDLLSLKEQIAGQYVEHLKKQKEGGLSDMVIGEGRALKDYLVSEGIGDRISDAIKGELFGKLFDAVDSKSFKIGGVEYTSIFDYLKPMKERLDAAKTDAELNALLTEVQSLDQVDDSSVVGGSVVAGTGVIATTTMTNNPELYSDRRKAVLNNIDAILKLDENDPIKYTWGGRKSYSKGLDCSGFVDYIINQSGLALSGSARTLFSKFSSKKLEIDDQGAIITDVSDIQSGDLLFWDSLDPVYYGKKDWIYEVKNTNGQKANIHHIAFIKSIDHTKGIVHIVESNGSQGVTESECSVSEWLNKKGKKKSALYAAHIDYSALDKMSEKDLAQLEVLPGVSKAA